MVHFLRRLADPRGRCCDICWRRGGAGPLCVREVEQLFFFRNHSRAPVPCVSRAGAGGGAPSLQCAAEARDLLQAEGWHTCPAWQDVVDGARPPQMRDTGLGDWPHGWQCHASRTRYLYFRERVLLLTLSPAGQMQLLRPRVPRPGLRLGQWSSVNPQGPHATRARGRLHGTTCAAAAQAMMLQRLAVLRRKRCHSIVVPRRRGGDAQGSWRRCCACARQQADELGCVTRPATDLDPEDNEAASTCPNSG